MVGLSWRSEEHTSELQSPCNLVCRLLLEKRHKRQEGRVSARTGVVTRRGQPRPSETATVCSCGARVSPMHLVTSSDSASCAFFFNDTATTEIYTPSLHDALPIVANFFFSASIGFCALAAIIRALRFGPDKVGSFFLDMWRVMIYMFLPVGFVFSLICLQQGMPMTFKSAHIVSTMEPTAMGTTDSGQAKQQTIVVGPLAAFIPMKQLGTNGGGFYGANSAHPFENPTALTNFLESVAMMLFPMALVLMYGRMLHKLKHAWVIFSVMMGLMIGTIVWTVYFDTYKPNPGITAH